MTRRFDAVLVDFGGVFTESPFAAAARAGAELGLTVERAIEAAFGPYDRDEDHPWHRLERGELPLEEACAQIRARSLAEVGHEVDPLVVLSLLSGSGVRAFAVEVVAELRGAGLATALVTNNAHELRPFWQPLIPLAELFDVVVDSCEVGVRKPDPAIYHHALRQLGVAAERAVFVDDYPGNVAAAEALGLTGVLVGHHVDEARAAMEELRRLVLG